MNPMTPTEPTPAIDTPLSEDEVVRDTVYVALTGPYAGTYLEEHHLLESTNYEEREVALRFFPGVSAWLRKRYFVHGSPWTFAYTSLEKARADGHREWIHE